MTVTNDLNLLIGNVKYEINYIDYKDNQYTVPVLLTALRAELIMCDLSIRKVRFTPILGNDGSFTFTHNNLFL